MDTTLVLLAGPLLRAGCNPFMVDQGWCAVEAAIVVDAQHAAFRAGVPGTRPRGPLTGTDPVTSWVPIKIGDMLRKNGNQTFDRFRMFDFECA
jgi:hypothetical protein